MTFDFDQEIDRKGTYCVKWEFVPDGDDLKYGDHADRRHGANRLLPMWVADMDFRVPAPVIEALTARAQHGIFGYTKPADGYFEAVTKWMERRYGRIVEKEWIVMTPGVVPAIHFMVQAYLQPGDKVLVQRPVYYPFFAAAEKNECEIVSNSLVLTNGRYTMDFADLAAKAADPAVKMAILCSPHNPIGRVWTKDELTRFGEICLENGVLVISDEIHCDLIYDGCEFTSFANISDEFAQKSIVCTAPSKTFNLAGLKTSNIIILDQMLRDQLNQKLDSAGIWSTNVFGIVATEAAYRHGEPWLEAAMAYVQDNCRFMNDYLAQNLPQLKMIQPEGTYLVWVDCRALGLDSKSRKELIMEQAKVFLDEGELFGPEGEGFERFNLACSRSILAEALERLQTAVSRLDPGDHTASESRPVQI